MKNSRNSRKIDSNQTLKEKLVAIVAEYKQAFPEEYALVVKQIKSQRDSTKNEFASVGEGEHAVERMLFTIPEALDMMFIDGLTVEEETEFRGGKTKDIAKWFAKKFPEFRSANTL